MLHLVDTDLSTLKGEAPKCVKLDRPMVRFGRGSLSMPVDAVVFARSGNSEIISRLHLTVKRTDDGYVLQDENSLNGSYVNGVRLRDGSSAPLKDGDIIQLGGRPAGAASDGGDDGCVKYRFVKSAIAGTSSHQQGSKRPRSPSPTEHNAPLVTTTTTTTTSTSSSISEVLDITGELAKLNRKIDAVEEEIASAAASSGGGVNDMKSRLVSLEKQKAEVLTLLRLAREREAAAGASSSSSSSSSLPAASSGTVAAPQQPPPPLPPQQVEQPRPKTHGRGQGAAGSAAGSGECAIHAGTLRSVLQCPLCGDCLLDAAVLPCSHGFCLSCLEREMRAKASSACPVCAGEERAASVSRGRALRPYVRSVHLDNAVDVLLIASTAAERSRYAERMAAARQYLTSIGVDPDAGAEDGHAESSGSGSSRGGGTRRESSAGSRSHGSRSGGSSSGGGSGGSEEDSYDAGTGRGRRHEDSCDA